MNVERAYKAIAEARVDGEYKTFAYTIVEALTGEKRVQEYPIGTWVRVVHPTFGQGIGCVVGAGRGACQYAIGFPFKPNGWGWDFSGHSAKSEADRRGLKWGWHVPAKGIVGLAEAK
jgi:hypothetical protein